MVLESADEVIDRVIQFRRSIANRSAPEVLRPQPLSTKDEVA
jgi:hypothetical protein